MLNREFPKPYSGLIYDRTKCIFLFGPYRLDAGERVLLRGEVPVSLTPKAFDTLLVLVSYGGRLVEKDRLLDEVWADTFVEEKTLAQNVLTIRKALGKAVGGGDYIETVQKRGYRFAAELTVVPRAAPDGFASTYTRTAITVEEEFETEDEAAVGRESHTFDVATARARSNILTASAHSSPAPGPEAKRKALTLGAVAAVIALCLLLSVSLLFWRDVRSPATPFQQFDLTKLTSSGDVSVVAISPDGKFAAYTNFGGGRTRLLVRQIDSTSSVEVVAPAEVIYAGLTFSNDGSSIFYVSRAVGGVVGTLYQVPVFGGTPKQIVEDVDSPVTLSPDGRRVAFMRINAEQTETALVVANVADGHEQKLAVRRSEEGFSLARPTWSPDGRTIATVGGANQLAKWASQILLVDTTDGTVRPFSTARWSRVGGIEWDADGKGLVLVAWDQESPVMSDQVWHVSYPQGATRRISNDVTGLGAISISHDARTMLTVRQERVSNFWSAPLAGGEARKLGGGVSDLFSERCGGFSDLFSERWGVAWCPDGRIVYASSSSGNPDIWIMDGDGANRRQLTSEPGGNVMPVVSPDGRFIMFLSYRTGERHVWRMNTDGSAPRQLTFGDGDDTPTISPDGNWIVYSSYAEGRPALWKVPSGGGESTLLTKGFIVESPAISPDGKWIACYHFADPVSAPKLALVSFDDGTLAKEYELGTRFAASPLRWTPDGSGVVFVSGDRGVSNFWLRPLDGAPARRLTNFDTDAIYRFDLARDGRLIYERGATLSDALLFRSK